MLQERKRGFALLLAIMLLVGRLPALAENTPGQGADSGQHNQVLCTCAVPCGDQMNPGCPVCGAAGATAADCKLNVAVNYAMAGGVQDSGSWDAASGTMTINNHEVGNLRTEVTTLLKGADEREIKTLKVSGKGMNGQDFYYIKWGDFAGLETLDFSGCNNMTEVPIGALDNSSFGGHDKLKTVVLPGTVTSIRSSAFDTCNGLASINLGNVTSIGAKAFWHCGSLTNINLANVTSIGSGAFDGCANLGQVNLRSVQSLDNTAFALCRKLTLASGSLAKLTGQKLEFQAFNICTKLGAVTLPPSITELGIAAFGGIPNLTLTLQYDGVVKIDDNPFAGCTNLTVLVPENQLEAYKQNSTWAALITPENGGLIPSVQVAGFMLAFADGSIP